MNDQFNDSTSSFQRQWSIRQANSRLHAYGLQSALENDLNRQVLQSQDDLEKNNGNSNIQHGVAIPLSELNSTNPYLSSQSGLSTMIQQPPAQHKSLRHKTYGFQDPFAVAPMEAWQEIKDYNLRVNGLPTLDQMMRLHTYSPLTQSNFATFLRRRHVHQNLNFLMELETHDKLWRAYLSSLDRQNRQRLSRFLESAAEKENGSATKLATMNNPSAVMSSSSLAGAPSYIETPDTDDLLTPLPPQPLTPRTPPANDNYASRTTLGDKSLNRHDLVQNALRIYRTYCSPLMDAAQQIHLPDDHRRALEDLIEVNERPEPIVFDSARSHVFEILNVFYYPLFVDQVLYKNISVGSCRLFLALGIIILTLAFSIELSLIFLDAGHSSSRWLPIIPFFFGWSCLITFVTEFAWWFGIFSLRLVVCKTPFFYALLFTKLAL